MKADKKMDAEKALRDADTTLDELEKKLGLINQNVNMIKNDQDNLSRDDF